MTKSQLFRLGLFQLAAGGLSVLFLGVLNRVMRVELGMELFHVSLLVGGGHYLGAILAIPFGFFSDRNPILKRRRTWYIWGGALMTIAVLCTAPWVAVWVAQDPSSTRLFLGFLFFLIEGISTFVAGVAYLALIADLNDEDARGPATGIVWAMLMVGIIATGISAGIAMKDYSFDGLVNLFFVGSGVAALLAVIGVLGQEQKLSQPLSAQETSVTLVDALRMVATNRSTRWFAVFLIISMFSFFMYDVILEPFGGDVFGLPIEQTTRFNSYLGVGVISAMLIGGMFLIPRKGKKWVTFLGCWLMVVAFGLLFMASVLGQVSVVPLWIFALGFGSGFFTVGGVALMMDMTSASHTGLFVGVWTVVQALAKGPASLAGGGLHDLFASFGATAGWAYGLVFAVEGVGLLLAILVLQRVQVTEFRSGLQSFGTLAQDSL